MHHSRIWYNMISTIMGANLNILQSKITIKITSCHYEWRHFNLIRCKLPSKQMNNHDHFAGSTQLDYSNTIQNTWIKPIYAGINWQWNKLLYWLNVVALLMRQKMQTKFCERARERNYKQPSGSGISISKIIWADSVCCMSSWSEFVL